MKRLPSLLESGILQNTRDAKSRLWDFSGIRHSRFLVYRAAFWPSLQQERGPARKRRFFLRSLWG